MQSEWMIRIAGALSAHFFQPDGSSRPGTDWSVELKRGEEVFGVIVRAYLSEDITKAARKDLNYQGQTVLGYISDLLEQGWTPDQEQNLSIVIQNPSGEQSASRDEHHASPKPWWKLW